MKKPYEIALSQYGLQETPGAASNREIEKYFEASGFSFTDDIAWCSAFMNFCQNEAGNEATCSLAAKSWLQWGEETKEPELGDVVVFHRGDPNSWTGHVGFFMCERYGFVWTLGGNQSNRVMISAYASSRVAGYRKAI